MNIQGKLDVINNSILIKPKKKKKWYQILLYIFIALLLCIGIAYTIFSIIYTEIDVIGVSMKPTFNNELDDTTTTAEAKVSKIKDKVCVNRFSSGKNGDIIVNQQTLGFDKEIINKSDVGYEHSYADSAISVAFGFCV